MKVNYKGTRIILKFVDFENFKYVDFKCGNSLIIYLHKNLSAKDRSKLLHKILKKARE